jgi:hypothetical protein
VASRIDDGVDPGCDLDFGRRHRDKFGETTLPRTLHPGSSPLGGLSPHWGPAQSLRESLDLIASGARSRNRQLALMGRL